MNFVLSNSNLVNNDETGCRQTNSFKTKAKRIVLMNLLASWYKKNIEPIKNVHYKTKSPKNHYFCPLLPY